MAAQTHSRAQKQEWKRLGEDKEKFQNAECL